MANQPYFEGSTLLIFGGDAGVSYDLSSTMALGIELGLRHQGKPGAAPLFADPKLARRQRHGRPLVAPDQRLRDGAVLMPAHEGGSAIMGRPRIMPLRRRLCRRAAASLVALALSEPGWAAPVSPDQAPAPLALPQVAQDIASPSTKVRRQALRGLRERGGPETLPLLASLLGDAELDIREGAVAGVIGVYVQPPGKRSINSAAAAFEVARFRVEVWPVPRELSGALVKALADEWPSVRRDAAYALGIVLTPPVSDAVAFEITCLPE